MILNILVVHTYDHAKMNLIPLAILMYCYYGPGFCQHSKPNLVMVMSDGFDGRLTFDPGSRVVQLPFINYLREMGAIFTRAYTNSPICCPSRAAMWSGKFVHLTQSWNNHKCLDANATTWMDLLQTRGYETKMIGKLDYVSGSHSVSNRLEAWTRDVPFLLRQEGRPVTQLVGNMSTLRVQTTDWKNTDMAVRWIQQRSSRQPFALYLGLNLPHTYRTESLGPTAGGSTFRTSPYWLTKVASDLISVPKWLPMASMHHVDFYSTFTKNCSGGFTDEEVKRIRGFYYAMCAETDAMLGGILSALRRERLLDNTVVLFTADHGELAMEHRQYYKMSMFEGSSHVPLLISGPGLKSGLQVEQLVSLVDIFPTVLDIVGVPGGVDLSGHSLLPFISKLPFSKRKHPDWVLSEYHGCNVNASTYMLRSGHWKYITYADGLSVEPQLFDLRSDLEELHDVAGKFPDLLTSLDAVLRGIVDYPKISKIVHLYNKEAFSDWRQSVGGNYSQVIADLRWHVDWQKDASGNERLIDLWLNGSL